MKNEKRNDLFEEHLRKIKHHVDYKINESPKYRPLVNDGEEFDSVPDSLYATRDGQPIPTNPSFTNEAGGQEDAPAIQGKDPIAPSNDQPIDADVPIPPNDQVDNAQLSPISSIDNAPMPPAEPIQQVDDIQNDIIKHNINAMQDINDKLEGLNNTVLGLNSKLDALNADVEEVREPTNSEKLMNKTNVSYPYYFNLNDFWKGNWFNKKRNDTMEKGVRELPDGTFVADFDDLPQISKMDVQNSFNSID